jgi:histidinol dehydrogenase
MAAKPKTNVLRQFASKDAKFKAEWAQLCDRRGEQADDVEKDVKAMIADVRADGDSAILAGIEKFDGAKLKKLEVTNAEWDAGCELVDPADRAAIGKAAMRVRDFHKKRIPSSWEMREEGGALMGARVRALERVGLYVPGGKAVYPSSVIMNAIPASVVEVPEIIMATPPQADGTVKPEVLMAARVAGVHRIFKMGGAHAIAAMAFGTETVPRVDKITGPGNIYVATAKKAVFGQVAIDSEAGPTEVAIIADSSATPAWIAADLISQAEHDELAQAILITHVKSLATRVQEQITKQLKDLERNEIATTSLKNRGAIIITKSIQESFDLANDYAAEHLVIATDSAETQIKLVHNAGAVFLGHYTPVAVGDYLAGPNHVLPTGGTARFFSPLGVDDFLKRTSFVRFEPPKLRELGLDIIRLAEVEGLTGHGRSVDLRLQKIRRARREREASRESKAEAEL